MPPTSFFASGVRASVFDDSQQMLIVPPALCCGGGDVWVMAFFSHFGPGTAPVVEARAVRATQNGARLIALTNRFRLARLGREIDVGAFVPT